MITIERITSDRPFDAQQINVLIAQLDPGRKEITEQDLADLVSNPNYFLLVARDGEKYVGLVSVVFQLGLGMWKCWGYDFVVDKPYRSQGIGDLLVRTGTDIMRTFSRQQKAVIQPYFTANASRVESAALHRKHGYVCIAEAVGPMGTNLYKKIINPDD